MTGLFDVTGKVAIVTGASRGIGQAIATRYAEAGMKVALISRKQDALDAVAEELRAKGADVLPIAAHNGDKAALTAMVEVVAARYGGVDVLVNNAATNPHFGPVLDAPDSMWQKTLEVNIMGPVWLAQAIVPVMRQRGGGKIIKAEVPLSEMFGYSTTLRSMSQGRATYTMEFKHYAEAPRNIAEAIINARTK